MKVVVAVMMMMMMMSILTHSLLPALSIHIFLTFHLPSPCLPYLTIPLSSSLGYNDAQTLFMLGEDSTSCMMIKAKQRSPNRGLLSLLLHGNVRVLGMFALYC